MKVDLKLKPIEKIILAIEKEEKGATLYQEDGNETVMVNPSSVLMKEDNFSKTLAKDLLYEEEPCLYSSYEKGYVSEKLLDMVENRIARIIDTVREEYRDGHRVFDVEHISLEIGDMLQLRVEKEPRDEVYKSIQSFVRGEEDDNLLRSLLFVDHTLAYPFFEEDVMKDLNNMGFDKDFDVLLYFAFENKVYISTAFELFGEKAEEYIVDTNYNNYIDGGGQNPHLELKTISEKDIENLNLYGTMWAFSVDTEERFKTPLKDVLMETSINKARFIEMINDNQTEKISSVVIGSGVIWEHKDEIEEEYEIC